MTWHYDDLSGRAVVTRARQIWHALLTTNAGETHEVIAQGDRPPPPLLQALELHIGPEAARAFPPSLPDISAAQLPQRHGQPLQVEIKRVVDATTDWLSPHDLLLLEAWDRSRTGGPFPLIVYVFKHELFLPVYPELDTTRARQAGVSPRLADLLALCRAVGISLVRFARVTTDASDADQVRLDRAVVAPVGRYLDLGTFHVTPEDMSVLASWARRRRQTALVKVREYEEGFFIAVPPDLNRRALASTSASPGLQHLLTFCQDEKMNLLRLDMDALTSERFPVFEW